MDQSQRRKAACNVFTLANRRGKPAHGGTKSVCWYEELQVDSVALTPRHCLDYIARVKRVSLDGEHYSCTCGCGVPGCSQIHPGVNIRHADGLIHWHSTKPGPERCFVFSASQYRHAILEALRFVGRTVTGGDVLPIGALDFTRQRFQRVLVATGLALQLDEPGSAFGKKLNLFAMAMESIRRADSKSLARFLAPQRTTTNPV
ncbi:MAG: hypothetical protein EBS05_26120 [Proteobacteria bacterium]|nr:hypothetical protein [Pseudomonadota bacterium]